MLADCRIKSCCGFREKWVGNVWRMEGGRDLVWEFELCWFAMKHGLCWDKSVFLHERMSWQGDVSEICRWGSRWRWDVG